MLPLKVFRKEQRSCVHFLWAKGQMPPFTLRCIQFMVTKCSMRRAIHVWCKKFVHYRESIGHEERPDHPVVLTTDAGVAAVVSLPYFDLFMK